MSFDKVEPIDPKEIHIGCLTCSTAAPTLRMNRIMATGFGQVTVTKGDEMIWSGDDPEREASEFEELAAKDPDHDWRIEFVGPLHGETYQRHGKENWVCIASNAGFA